VSENGPYPLVQLRYLARTGTGHTPARTRPDYWVAAERTIPWMTLADVGRLRDGTVNVVSETVERLSATGVGNSSAVVHPAGTVFLSRTASVGFSAIMGCPMAVSQDFMTWTPGPRLHGPFLLHVLRGMRPRLLGLMYGSTHKTIYMPDLLALRTPLPEVERQRAIVEFLDRECDRIAVLKACVQRLKAAGAASLRDWFRAKIAERPLIPLRRCIATIADGPFGSSIASAHYVDEPGVRVIRLADIGLAEFRERSAAFVADEYAKSNLSEHRVMAGDLVMAGLGDANNPLGRAALVPTALHGAIHKADCYRIKVDELRWDPHYVSWALSYGPARDEAPLMSRGSTRARLNTVVARDLPVPSLPLDEQHGLVRAAQRRREGFRAVSGSAAALITLLVEYRDALITEAVTGQLNVTAASDAQMDERLHEAVESATA
jgi:type I restriction enzyme S subunit